MHNEDDIINKLYVNFEKKFFVFLSFFMIILCIVLTVQYHLFFVAIERMNHVKNEYYHYIDMVKNSMHDENIHEVVQEDGLEELSEILIFDELNREDSNDSDTIIPTDISMQDLEEELLDEQQEDPHIFQFISLEDEQQIKNLRKKTREVISAHKQSQKKTYEQNQLVKEKLSSKKINTVKTSLDFSFQWPLELHNFWISSLFGARKKANGDPGFHYGIDLAALKGTPVKAAAAGQVIQAQYLPGYGNNILIQHSTYYRTRYAHLDKINVTVGQKVVQGQKIGAVGDSGSVRKSGTDASHLHFEIYHNGTHVNPLRYLFS